CCVKASFTLAKNGQDLIQPMRAQPEGNKAAPGLCLRDAPWGSKHDVRLGRRAAAIGRGRGLAEHPLEDRVDVLEMIAEVEIFLELGGAEVLAQVLVGCEQ